MRNFNLNQKKLVSEGLINLSIAFISIGIVGPVVSKSKIDNFLLITVLIFIILSLLLISISVNLLNK